MATSYKLVLKANKLDAKGEMPLYIRVTANRKTSFFATGIKLLPELWDEDKEAVKKKHRNSQRLNHFLAEKLVEVQAKAIELENQGSDAVSAKQVKQALRKPASSSFIEYFQNYLTWLERNGSVGTHDKAIAVFSKLNAYVKGQNLSFSDVSPEFLRKYEAYLKDKLENSANTIHSNLKVIRKLFNDAVRQDLVPIEKNPFLRFRLRTEKTQRSYLTEEEIHRLEALIIPSTHRLNAHRWMYVFACYAGGLRISDLLQLRWKDFNGTHLTLVMQKTKEVVSIRLPHRALEIVDLFKEEQPTDPTHFIFPFLKNDGDYSSPKVLFRAISSNTAYANKNLKQLAEMAEIDKHLSFHTSRHTFATQALRKKMRMEHVSKLMGHSNLKTTQIYAKIVNEDLDNAMEVFNH